MNDDPCINGTAQAGAHKLLPASTAKQLLHHCTAVCSSARAGTVCCRPLTGHLSARRLLLTAHRPVARCCSRQNPREKMQTHSEFAYQVECQSWWLVQQQLCCHQHHAPRPPHTCPCCLHAVTAPPPMGKCSAVHTASTTGAPAGWQILNLAYTRSQPGNHQGGPVPLTHLEGLPSHLSVCLCSKPRLHAPGTQVTGRRQL
jgi:hypothetical protein